MELLQYAFFRHALVGALLVSVCCGIIGTYVVTRRRVFIAGGITHASLGGLGLGVLLGVSPTAVAALFAVAAAVAVQWLSRRRNIREDSAIAVCWSLGMALGIIFIFLTPGYAPNLTEYLFGNILAITRGDLAVAAAFTAVLAAFAFVCRRPVLYVAFDAEFARLQGFRAAWVEYAMTVLTAVTIVLSIRLIGIVLLLSVLTLPQMMANLLCHDYGRMTWLSCLLCFIGCTGGLWLSVVLNVPSGACIVALMVVLYLAMRGAVRWLRAKRSPQAVAVVAWGAAALSAMALLNGCAANNAMNRRMKGLTTRYNIHFNGNEAYRAGVTAMEKSTDDDYSQRLLLHPVDQLVDLEEPKADANFDRAIEKCKKCVTTKSITRKPKKKRSSNPQDKEYLKRGEYNPYLHNAWLLSGKAQFHKGDFTAAAATFSYTARHFYWRPLTVSECHIWAARCHAVQGYVYDAEAELDLVIPRKKFDSQQELSRLPEYQNLTRRLQREFSLVMAEICLHQEGREAVAIGYLQKARKAFITKEQRVRTSYLIAQLQQATGDTDGAYKTYSRIVSRARNYKTQFNARMARITVRPEVDGRKVEKRLNRMRRQSRNKEYLDQIHYAIGNVRLARGDTARAIESYEMALEKSSRGGMDKAVAALKLGEVTFAQGDYVRAQKAYATAMSILKPDFNGYADIARLSGVLDELQTHAETVQLQDSLLRLSALPDEEVDKIIDRIIEDLIREEKEAEEAERLAEYENRKSQTADPLAQQPSALPTVGEKDNSWYFYNKATVAAGKTEFQRLWGARKPEDDWRRRNKTATFSWGDETAEATEAAETGRGAATGDGTPLAEGDTPEVAPDSTAATEAVTPTMDIDAEKAADPHNREYYWAQIPRTEEAIANSHTLIEDGTYNMGVIINEKLENFPLAISTFEELERRYPESAYRLETYYAIYLMYMRMNRPAEAEAYRQKLMSYFPESAYAVAVSDPNYIETLRGMSARQDSLYGDTYHAYLDGATATVHGNYDFVHETWPLCPLMPKFLFLHALSYVQEGDVVAFREALEQLTALYPESDVSPLASLMVKGVQEGRTVQGGTSVRGLLWSTSLRQADDSTATDAETAFVNDPALPHVLLLAFVTDSVNANDLLFETAKFNFENYLIKDFDLEIIRVGELSLLVVSGFDSLEDLLDYRDKMSYHAGIVLPDGVTAINISEPNFRALLQGRTFEEYFQFIGTDAGDDEWIEETDASPADEDAEEAPDDEEIIDEETEEVPADEEIIDEETEEVPADEEVVDEETEEVSGDEEVIDEEISDEENANPAGGQ